MQRIIRLTLTKVPTSWHPQLQDSGRGESQGLQIEEFVEGVRPASQSQPGAENRTPSLLQYAQASRGHHL